MGVTRTNAQIESAPGLPLTDLTVSSPEPAVDVGAGAALLAEAKMLVSERRWKEACKALDSVNLVAGHTCQTDQLLAVAATHAGERRLANEAIAKLRSELDPSLRTVNALTTVALARREYEAADLLSRRAVEMDSHNAEAWANLSASYAGLGWFDQAEDCLDRAEALGIENDRRWFIGQAINNWGLTRTWAAIVTLALVYSLGLLALAIGITVPFLVREVRVSRLNDRFAELASDAWRSEYRMRFGFSAAVSVILVIWAVTVSLG